MMVNFIGHQVKEEIKKENYMNIDYLNSRKAFSLRALCLPESWNERTLILTQDSDQGVILNGGRLGSRFGAEVITEHLFKMNQSKDSKHFAHFKLPFANDFERGQQNERQAIKTILEQSSFEIVLHLGGGHDHIYPLVMAIEGPLHILNIDAHLDTRNDQQKHSGTPFRQILSERKDITLTQIGIHDFANPKTNYELPMTILGVEETYSFVDLHGMQKLFELGNTRKAPLLISLDADALEAACMPAVSAPNHCGLSAAFVTKLFSAYKDHQQEKKYVGIYEYNPLFDSLGAQGARYLASLLYPFI
jgi:formiminoglutamase